MSDEQIEQTEFQLAKVAPTTEPARGDDRVLALERMSDEEFENRLAILSTGLTRLGRLTRTLLVPGVDYGVIPGTSRGRQGEAGYVPGKKTLLKSGAEKLCKFYGLVATFDATRTIGGDGEPPIRWEVQCSIHAGDTSGPLVAQGIGTSSSWERKHRYRRGQRSCPACGAVGTLVKSKFPPKGAPKGTDPGWWCRKDIGCGADFEVDDPQVTKQAVGDVENPDQWDLDNTLAKMAVKRALVDATLRATATSGYFTQDLEDELPPEQAAPGVDLGRFESIEPEPEPEPQRTAQPPKQASEPSASERVAGAIRGTDLDPDVWSARVAKTTTLAELSAVETKLGLVWKRLPKEAQRKLKQEREDWRAALTEMLAEDDGEPPPDVELPNMGG